MNAATHYQPSNRSLCRNGIAKLPRANFETCSPAFFYHYPAVSSENEEQFYFQRSCSHISHCAYWLLTTTSNSPVYWQRKYIARAYTWTYDGSTSGVFLRYVLAALVGSFNFLQNHLFFGGSGRVDLLLRDAYQRTQNGVHRHAQHT